MNYIKRRISLFLCMLLIFTTAFAAVPTETQAATISYSYSSMITYEGYELVVYKGAKNIYIGDLINVTSTASGYWDKAGTLSNQKKVTYTSSKSSVAAIGKSTGLLSAKKAGTTVITIKHAGKTMKATVRVLTEKNFYKELGHDYYKNQAKSLDKSAAAFLKKTGMKTPTITDSNRYKLLSAYKNYEENSSGSLQRSNYNQKNGTYTYSTYLYSPSAAHANAIYNFIADNAENENPFNKLMTDNGKAFSIKSISGKAKSKAVTINLNKAVTADQIYGATYAFSWDTDVKSAKTYTVPMMVQDTSNSRKYYAVATIKQGSKTITLQLKNAKLVKGKTYKLLSNTNTKSSSKLGNWLLNGNNINTFKAK